MICVTNVSLRGAGFRELVRSGRAGQPIVQQADESLAYDIAWPESHQGPAIVAWDEDAPPRPGGLLSDRGVVKVQLLGVGAKSRVASPESSDAEAPRLIARRNGYWLAWLARRAEPTVGSRAQVQSP